MDLSVESRASVDLRLRTQQALYLRRAAERDDVTLSDVFANIVERYAEIARHAPRSPRKDRCHVSISPEHLTILNKLSVMWGLSRSDVARRLIDGAVASDRTQPRR